METQVRLIVDESVNPAEVLQTLGDNIRVLANIETYNDNETQTINWLVDLLAAGVTNIADKLYQL